MAGARCPLQAPHAFVSCVFQTGAVALVWLVWRGQRVCGCAGAPPGVQHPTLNIINLVTVALENETRATVALLARRTDADVTTSPPGYSYSQRASLQHADVNLVDLAWAPVHFFHYEAWPC